MSSRCPRCYRVQYTPDTPTLDRQLAEYGSPCRCPDRPRVRDAFDVLEEMAKR